MSNVAIIGLGAMGYRMASNLLEAGHRVVVYNRTAERATSLIERGAVLAESPRRAAEQADIAISMVTDDNASRAVWLDADTGILGGLRAGSLAIESSTLTHAWVTELADAVRSTGAEFLDAPVAGSRPQAEAGALVYLVGGSEVAFDKARHVLSAMGSAIHHIGPAGSGMMMKLAVNALFGIQSAAFAEILSMLDKSGVRSKQAVEVLSTIPITSPAMKVVSGAMVARSFAPMFPIDLVAKDFRYVVDTAERAGAYVPTATAVCNLFDRAAREGHGGDNITGVIQIFD